MSKNLKRPKRPKRTRTPKRPKTPSNLLEVYLKGWDTKVFGISQVLTSLYKKTYNFLCRTFFVF